MILNDTTDISNGFVQQTWLAYKGNNRWPAVGTDKYNRIVMIANRKLRELAGRGTKNWRFFWDQINLDDLVTAGIRAYGFPNNVIKASDSVFIDDDENNEMAEYKIVAPQRRNLFGQCCYITDANPLILNFSENIEAGNPIVGMTIRVPVYARPSALSDADDTIPLPEPDWLVYETAAELARNDPAKDDQFGNLQGIANDKFADMVATDEGSPFGQPNSAAVITDMQIGERSR